MKMIILFIDDNNLWIKNDAKLNANIYNSIIDELFHIIPFFSNILILISMLKFSRVLMSSNIFLNIYSSVMIEQLWYYKMKLIKLKIISTHVIYRHSKQFGIFLVSNCIINLQRFNVYKFIFSMNRLSYSTMI